LSAGWSGLDNLYNISKGQFTVLTGIPGSGKSNFLDDLMVNMAEKHNWKFAVFSPENQPVSRHLRSLIEKHSRTPMFPGIEQNLEKFEIAEHMEWINQHFVILNPNITSRKTDIILNQLGNICKENNIDGVVIDPWNELEHTRPNNMSETEYTAESLIKFKKFANRYDIHLWIIAHPTKLKRIETGNDKGKYPVPSLYDISGSAHWRNKADCGLSLYRDFKTNEVTLYIQKIRFKDNGNLGYIPLEYDNKTGRYREKI